MQRLSSWFRSVLVLLVILAGAPPIQAGPGLTSVYVGASNVFGVGSNGYLRHAVWNGSSWVQGDLGGGWSTSTGLTKMVIGGLPNVFGVGSNGHLLQAVWGGSSWAQGDLGGSWSTNTGLTKMDVGGMSNVFGVGSNGYLRHAVWNGSSWTQGDLGGGWSTSTGLTSMVVGLPNVFGVGSNGHLLQAVWNGSSWVQGDLGGSWAVTCTISGNAGVAGASVTINGCCPVTSDSSGNYSFTNAVQAGTWTITPSKSGYAFTPASRSVTVPPSATGVNFTAAAVYSISGNVGVSGVTVRVGGLTTTSDASGNYAFSNNVIAGSWTVTPSKSGCSFAPTSRTVTVGPSQSGISFSTPCSLGFPHGATSFADNYIKNYPYGTTTFQRYQEQDTVNNLGWYYNGIAFVEGGVSCTPLYLTCMSGAPNYVPYPVYATTFDSPLDCNYYYGYCPTLKSISVLKPHPRPQIGSGVPIFFSDATGTGGFNNDDTAGYDYTSVGGGYREFNDKIIVVDPLGSTDNPNCPGNSNLCNTVHPVSTATWGAAALKVYPGEITPNYWGTVPTAATANFGEWQTLVARGGNLNQLSTVRQGAAYVMTINSYVEPERDVMDGVFGGGNGPACIAGANECWQVTWNSGPSRVKIDRIGSEWYVTISGYATNLDGIIRNTVDVGVDLAALAGSGSVHDTMYNTILLMNQLGIADTANIVGHSLGALDAVTLYNLGYGKSVTGFATPFMTPFGAMLSRGGRPATFYANTADWVTNQLGLCGPYWTHDCRTANGVNEYLVNTGGSYVTGNNPHDRNQYIANAPGGTHLQW